jgi:hypothetical protein
MQAIENPVRNSVFDKTSDVIEANHNKKIYSTR